MADQPHPLEIASWWSGIGSAVVSVISTAVAVAGLWLSVRMYRDAKAQGDLLKTLFAERNGAPASEFAAVSTPAEGTDTPTSATTVRRDLADADSGAEELQLVKTWLRRARMAAISFAVIGGVSAVFAGFGWLYYLTTPAHTEQLAVASTDRAYQRVKETDCSEGCRTFDVWKLPEGGAVHVDFSAPRTPDSRPATMALVLQVDGCDSEGSVEWNAIINGSLVADGRAANGESRTEFVFPQQSGMQFEARRLNGGNCTVNLRVSPWMMVSRQA